jgi:hypothetical protein
MIVQTFQRGSKTLELHRFEGSFIDDDGHRVINEYWECRISDREKPIVFSNADMAFLFISQNEWKVVDF